VSDLFFNHKVKAQLIQQQQAMPGGGGGHMMSPETGGEVGQTPLMEPLPNIVDRGVDIQEIVDNYDKLMKLVESNKQLWSDLLSSKGQKTDGFLDDPTKWDDKKWTEAVHKTERLLRDANNALMKIGTGGADIEPEVSEEDVSSGGMPGEGEGGF